MMTVVMRTPPVPSSRDQQARAAIMDLLAVRAVNDRLAAAQPGTAPGKVGIFIADVDAGHRQIMLWDNFQADQWRSAVAGLRTVTCRLTRSGFTDTEWAAAKRNVIADLEHRVGDMAKVPDVELAKDLSHALAGGRELIPPDELLEYTRSFLPKMHAQSASDWWRRQWQSGVEHLRVEAPELATMPDPLPMIRSAANEATGSAGCRMRR